ncbi:MAG: Crp/Fnr family transcriptional regulator [Gammaproteobacteria bacterium]|nr:Crp/Fnr family transcriptional regulator [Gammaproteobacteria bacterium]MBU2056429.1 Crp/Fnr family transcriptional regulator [Gammaproteobacteria bacterium]MBU2175499.1 Crp/Fnr family transcriptional regulator [Gammaproteobacteria bacterium]MBU2246654.1 Crp/Fnr family transcriptional regulator [Gammaproteobacteria bacterium]MBU2345882.1 Crp/Fnr family transcriptional regulator [Gammaproteobacteria bacterium]
MSDHFALQLRQHSNWFAALSDAQQQQLLAQAKLVQLGAGQRLFSRGDQFDGIYVLLSGALLIAGVHSSGREALLTIVEAGDWIGEIALFDGKARTHDATASVSGQLLHLNSAALQLLVQQDPLWWQRFGQLLTEKMRQVFQALEDISLLPASIRLARRLLMLCRLHQQGERYLIPAQQEQLGQLLSLSRQTINQLLQQLVASGVIRTNYGEIEVLDVKLLKQAAEVPAD